MNNSSMNENPSDIAREAAEAERRLNLFAREAFQTTCSPTMADVMRAITRATAASEERVRELENESRNVPLCGDHALTWFTARYFKPGDCWFCQLDVRIATLERELAAAKEERAHTVRQLTGALDAYEKQVQGLEAENASLREDKRVLDLLQDNLAHSILSILWNQYGAGGKTIREAVTAYEAATSTQEDAR